MAARCHIADRALPRLRGLLGRRALDPGEGMLIVPARSIHTVGMRFAIDAVFIDRGGIVVRVAPGLAAFPVPL